MTNRLSEMLEMARKNNGYQALKWSAVAAYVATDAAAERRGHAGKIVVGLEWYMPESFDDDDASTGGWLLPLRSGYTRDAREVAVDSIDEAMPALRSAGIADRVLSVLSVLSV